MVGACKLPGVQVTMRITLFRAGNDDVMTGPTSFAADIDDARAYLDNPGFGGGTLYETTVCICRRALLDVTDSSDQEAAIREAAGLSDDDYGAVTADFLLSQQPVVDALVDAGYEWVRLLDTYPEGAVVYTWLYAGDEPELTEIEQ